MALFYLSVFVSETNCTCGVLLSNLACSSCLRKNTLFLEVPVFEDVPSSRLSTPRMPNVLDLVPTAMTSLSYGNSKSSGPAQESYEPVHASG